MLPSRVVLTSIPKTNHHSFGMKRFILKKYKTWTKYIHVCGNNYCSRRERWLIILMNSLKIFIIEIFSIVIALFVAPAVNVC